MRKLVRSLHDRLGVRGWLALCLVAVSVAVAAPRVAGSRFVAQWRAAQALRRAEEDLAARRFDQARVELLAALRFQPGDAGAHRRLAAMELELGNTDLAFLEYQSLAEMHPEDPEGFIGLADLMVKSGLLEAPEAVLDRAIDADAQRPDARLLRGGIRFRLGRYHGALEDARVAVDKAPADPVAWTLLVRSVAHAQGAGGGMETARRAMAAVGERPDLQAALASLERVGSDPAALAALLAGDAGQSLGPSPAPPRRLRPDAQTDRGSLGAWTREHWPGHLAAIRQSLDAQLQRQDWAEAQRTVDSAAQAYPGSAFSPFLAGVLELARDNLDQAEARLSEALAIAPRSPAVLGALGKTWSRKGGAAFAAGQLMGLATRDPGLALARYMAARAYIEAGDPLRAEASLRRGLELQPDSPVPYQHLTDFYFGLDRAAEALDICRQGLDRFPRSADLQMMLAQIEAGIGQPGEAIRAYQELTARRPDLDLAQYKLAMLLATDESARPRFLAALQPLRGDKPSDPLLLDALGWMHFRAGDARLARELLLAAVAREPDEPRLHYHLALVHAKVKEAPLARQQLQAALASPRPFPERIDALRLLRQDEQTASSAGQASAGSPRH
jgi:tetratricopeptide (TPR) repeat protein